MPRLLLLLFGLAFLLSTGCNTIGYTAPDDDGTLVGDDDASPSPTPIPCDPATDLDGDGWCFPNDCDDFNSTVNPGQAENCASARDDDCDELIDCADPDCTTDPECVGQVQEICDNSIDDDNDGAIDCEDADCSELPICGGAGVETNCVNGLDDDADGFTDCIDPDCIADPACNGPNFESNCNNGLDDDSDGLTDCADSDCAADPACTGGQPCVGQDLLINGDFETGSSPWTEHSDLGWDLRYDNSSPVPPYTGSYLMWLGGDNNEWAYIEQQVLVPPSATSLTLNYHWAVTTDEIFGPYDNGGVLVTDSAGLVLEQVFLFDDTDSTGGSWVAGSNTLLGYAGQSIRIHFGIATDGSLPTSFFVDDVQLICN